MNKYCVYTIVILVLVSGIYGAPSGGSYGGAYGSGAYGSAGSGADPTLPPGIPPEIAALIKNKLSSKVNTATVPAGPGGGMITVGMPKAVANLIKGLIDANTAVV